MRNWEYMPFIGVEKEIAPDLNSLCAEGWDVVNADKNEEGFRNYFFKRPVGDSP